MDITTRFGRVIVGSTPAGSTGVVIISKIALFMKKLLFVVLVVSTCLFFIPEISYAVACPAPYDQGLVPCGQLPTCRCDLADIFLTILRVYNFVVRVIATPLAVLLVALGGVLIMVSGFNANWYQIGKRFIIWALVSLLLIWGSWLIIDVILQAIGYTGQWHRIF